jgi:capsular polysaccharide biosynthesis protein
MNFARVIRSLVWKPEGFVPSLDSLNESHGVLSKRDVAMAVSGSNEGHPLTVVELADGKIIGDLRLVATAGDGVVGGVQGLFGCSDPQNHYLLRRRRLRMLKRRHGTALLLGAANSDNYYHWLVDSVPRWKMLQAADWSNYDFVLLHSKPLRFQDEVLDRLGIPMEKRLRCSKNFVHQFERLIVPAKPPHDVSPWVASCLRSLFPGNGSGPEKIFLPRGTASKRRLVNEDELERALKVRGFVTLDPGALSVSDQAKRFSAAKYVIAPHGAALTNLIFSPPGAFLLELFHPQHKNNCYVNVAAGCGHRYASLDGRAVTPASRSNLDYVVDVNAVLQMLAENG